jgi:phenylpropionate dioxygenase-like ring-hydroxylating dioxygenase large terminal subunit
VEQGCLVCPYHGWRYDHFGACVFIPSQPEQPPPVKARANTFRAQEAWGLVWVTLGEPTHGLPQIRELEDTSFRQLLAGPYTFEAQGPRIIENFLDVAHLPVVHEGLLGTASHAAISDYPVESTPDGLIARDIAIFQPDPDGSGQPAEVLYTYEVHRPLMASFRKRHLGQTFFMADIVTPIDDERSIAFAVLAFDSMHETPDTELLAFQDKITMQDKPIVESQRPELLPLDLQAELHLRSDRAAIAYRRYLRQIGMTYGTA